MHYTLPRGRVYVLLTAIFVPILFLLASQARGVSTSVVISQVQITGVNASDEFVELFNASDYPVNLDGWRLSRRSASATASAQNLVASLSGTISGKSYFLIANPSASSSGLADRVYSATSSGIAVDNTVILYSDNGVTVVDKVGFGTAQDAETTPFATNPTAGQSIERKPCGLDTDDNSTDFALRSVSLPHNSTFPAQTLCSATPTPTLNPTLEPTPTPSAVPSATPMPTLLPTPTPETTATPTSEPTPTPIPTPMNTPSPTSTPRPSHDEHKYRFPRLVCVKTNSWHWLGRFRWWMPEITCHWEFRNWHD